MMEKLLNFPTAAAEHAGPIDQANYLVHWLMLVLFVGWGAFFLFALFRFRRSRNPRASYTGAKSHMSTYMEVGVAIAEAILLIGFSIPLWAQRVNEVPPDADSTVVRMVAQQFAWNVWYPGADGKFGRQQLDLVDEETNPLGIVLDDPDAADDITTINQLHVPVDKPVVMHLSSKDVIHAVNQPHMRLKQDAIPGMSIPMWWVPTKTTDQMRQELGDDEFVYEIACAQLCGNSHYSMRGFITVHTAAEFEAWIAEQEPLAAAGGDDFWD